MRLYQRLLLLFGVLCAAVLVASPAFAEFTSEPQSDWGVQTKGASNTIAQWDALTWAVDQVDGTIFIGGNFLEVTNGSQTHSQGYLAAFDAGTGDWQSWFRPEVGDAVFALQPTPDGGLLVAGEMGEWNGQTRGALVKIDPATGELWPGWNTRVYGASSVIRDMSLEADGFVYAVGQFTTVTDGNGPIAAGGAVRFDPVSGTIDTTWLPSLQLGTGWGVSRSKTRDVTYIAGFFQRVDGDTSARGLVGLADDGTIVMNRDAVPYNGCTTWSYCSQMYDVEATEYGELWIGGVEHALYVIDEADGTFLKMHYSGCDPTRNDECLPNNWYGGEFQELERVGDRIYATCHCWYDLFSADELMLHTKPELTPGAEHSTVDALMAFDAQTHERIQSFRPYLTGASGGFGMHVNPDDGCLWATGDFQSYGAPGGPQPPARDVVRICDETGPTPNSTPAATPPVPQSCSAALVDAANPDLGAKITWTNAPTSVGTIIYRSVDGGGSYWRGRIDPPALSEFIEPIAGSATTQYFGRHIYPGGQRSPLTPCGTLDLTPELIAPAACAAEIDLEGRAALSWDAGNDATEYVVRRSVDGGNFYWRGLTTETTFAGVVLSPGRTYDYTVTAKAGDGSSTEPVPCTPSLTVEFPELVAPTVCTGVIDVDGRAALTWDSGTNASSYIVRRSVNGGTAYWRGATSELSFSGATLSAGNEYDYSVSAKGANGTVTSPIPCSPTLSITIPAPGVLTSCEAFLVNGNDYQTLISFPQVDNAARYIIRRSADGGPFYWRASAAIGLEDGFAAFYDAPIIDFRTYVYSVEVVGLDGSVGLPVPCSPAITVEAPVVPALSVCEVSPEFLLTWTDTIEGDVVISRSVNGGTSYWRGRVAGPSGQFADTGTPGLSYSYSAVVVAPDGRRSDPTPCSPA